MNFRKIIGKAGFSLVSLFFVSVWLDLMLAMFVDSYDSMLVLILANPRGGPGVVALCYLVLAGMMALADPEEW